MSQPLTIPLRFWFETPDQAGQRGIGNIEIDGRIYAFAFHGWRGKKVEGVVGQQMLCTATITAVLQTEAEMAEFRFSRDRLANGMQS